MYQFALFQHLLSKPDLNLATSSKESSWFKIPILPSKSICVYLPQKALLPSNKYQLSTRTTSQESRRQKRQNLKNKWHSKLWGLSLRSTIWSSSWDNREARMNRLEKNTINLQGFSMLSSKMKEYGMLVS